MFEKLIKKTARVKSGLKIVIVGCGKVGGTLVEQLSKEGHDIVLVDRSAERLHALTDIYDVMGVVGNGASFSTLSEAGIEDADMIIAVTDSDELNLLTCTVARREGNCTAIARVRNPEYSQEIGYLQERLGLAMIINPDKEAANEIARVLSLPAALGVNTFAHGLAEMVRVKIPEGSVLCNKSLAWLGRDIRNILICAVERGNDVCIPTGNFVLQEGDIITFLASTKEATVFLEDIGIQTNRIRHAILIGGGRSAYYLAKQLMEVGVHVKIIEKDKARSEELSILLPNAIVLNADGTETAVLKEAGMEQVDAFIPLTGIDEENILLTLHAKEVSKAKVITKINRINFHGVINRLELGSVIYPKYIVAEAIIAYVRALTASKDSSNVETLYHLFDYRTEAIEFHIKGESDLTNKPLKDLKLKDNVLIGCINRDGHIIIPGGNDCIKPNDSVIIVTTHTGFDDIREILK